MRPVLALLLLTACAALKPVPQPVACVSKCGVKLYVPRTQPTPSCEAFQAVEDGALRAFASDEVTGLDSRFTDACRRLSYFGVEIGDPVLMDPVTGLYNRAGMTMCEYGRIFIGHRDDIRRSALAHEFAHAILSCQRLMPVSAEDSDHSNWTPINAALRDAGFP